MVDGGKKKENKPSLAHTQALKLVRAGHSIVKDLTRGQKDRALANALYTGVKLAAVPTHPLKNPFANPLRIYDELQKLGIKVLGWTPETLMSEIDRLYNHWSSKKLAEAIESFHNTGDIKTDVPSLLRQKIYAIRTVCTSDSAHSEWHIFEKVGSVFNDRLAKFGVVEKLSPAECAKTVAIINAIRPDEFTNEICTYIAASCYEDGYLTLKPSHFLNMADSQLQKINFQMTGERPTPEFIMKVSAAYDKIKAESKTLLTVADDVATIQAIKCLAADGPGFDVLAEEH